MAKKMINLMDDLAEKKQVLNIIKEEKKAAKGSKKSKKVNLAQDMSGGKSKKVKEKVYLTDKGAELALAERNAEKVITAQNVQNVKELVRTDINPTYYESQYNQYPGYIFEYLGEKPYKIIPEDIPEGSKDKNITTVKRLQDSKDAAKLAVASTGKEYSTLTVTEPSFDFSRTIRNLSEQAKQWEQLEKLSDEELISKGYAYKEKVETPVSEDKKKTKLKVGNKEPEPTQEEIEREENRKAINKNKSPSFHDLTEQQYIDQWSKQAKPEIVVEGQPYVKGYNKLDGKKGLDKYQFLQKGMVWDPKLGKYVKDKDVTTTAIAQEKTVFNGKKGRLHAEVWHDKDAYGQQDKSKEDINRASKSPNVKYKLSAANVWEPVYSGQAAVIVDKDGNAIRVADTRETNSLVKNILIANADSPEALARLQKEVLVKENALSDLTADMVTDNYAVESHIKEFDENGNPVLPTQIYKWNKDVLFNNPTNIGIKGKRAMIPEQGVEVGYFTPGKKIYKGQGQNVIGKPNRDILRGGELFKFAKEEGGYDWDAVSQHYGISHAELDATVKPFLKSTDAELDAADKAFEEAPDVESRIQQAKDVTAEAENTDVALNQLGLLRRSVGDYVKAYEGEKKGLEKDLGTPNLIKTSDNPLPYSSIGKYNGEFAGYIASLNNKNIKEGMIRSIDPIPGIAKYVSKNSNSKEINPVDTPLMAAVKNLGIKSKKDFGEKLSSTTNAAIKGGYQVGTQDQLNQSIIDSAEVLQSDAYKANKKLASGTIVYDTKGLPYVRYGSNVKDVSENSGLGIKFTPDMAGMYVRVKGTDATAEHFMKSLATNIKQESKAEAIDTTAGKKEHKAVTSGSEIAAGTWSKKTLAEKKDELEKGK